MVEKNVVVSEKVIKGKIKATSFSSNGIDDLKELFIMGNVVPDPEISCLDFNTSFDGLNLKNEKAISIFPGGNFLTMFENIYYITACNY